MSRYWSQGLVGRNDSSSGCRLQWMQPTARCVWDAVGLEMEMETEGVAVVALGAVAFGWRHTFVYAALSPCSRRRPTMTGHFHSNISAGSDCSLIWTQDMNFGTHGRDGMV